RLGLAPPRVAPFGARRSFGAIPQTIRPERRRERERRYVDRVDRRDVESRPRLHEDQPRLRPLLRRDVRRAVSRRRRPPLRAGLRPPPRAPETAGAAPLGTAPHDLRQLDE